MLISDPWTSDDGVNGVNGVNGVVAVRRCCGETYLHSPRIPMFLSISFS